MKNFWQKLSKPLITTTPMAGITDSAWRQICKSYGADVVHTEFVSADALYYGSKKTKKMIAYQKKEQPVVVQLFSKRPEMYSQAAKIVEATGVAGIDINFGCPAKKVASHGGGICLLRDLPTVQRIVEEVTKSVQIPVSVKTRASITDLNKGGNITALDFIEALKDYPLSALIIHGRSYEKPFTGSVDLEILKEANLKFKKYFPNSIFLINGSFQTIESVVQDLEYTKADGLALSRALYGKPWLFRQIKEYLQTGKYTEITWSEKKDTIIKHAHLLYEDKGSQGFKEIRKHLLFYTKGYPQATQLRKRLVTVKNPQEVEIILKDIIY